MVVDISIILAIVVSVFGILFNKMNHIDDRIMKNYYKLDERARESQKMQHEESCEFRAFMATQTEINKKLLEGYYGQKGCGGNYENQ